MTVKKKEPNHEHRIALGMAPFVNAPITIVDEKEQTLVALQLLGPSQAVNANWAALVGGGKSHYILNEYVTLKGMKAHVKMQKMLPATGWKEMWLLHKQASHSDLDASKEFFYLLDNEERDIPASFIPMLDKIIPIPLQEQWSEYLFYKGLDKNIISPFFELCCVGWHCYKVFKKGWDDIVSEGIAQGRIGF